jgi:hypothetical protein
MKKTETDPNLPIGQELSTNQLKIMLDVAL